VIPVIVTDGGQPVVAQRSVLSGAATASMCSLSAQRRPRQHDAVRLRQQAVKHGVGHGWLVDSQVCQCSTGM
jgi:hypothetical protein